MILQPGKFYCKSPKGFTIQVIDKEIDLPGVWLESTRERWAKTGSSSIKNKGLTMQQVEEQIVPFLVRLEEKYG